MKNVFKVLNHCAHRVFNYSQVIAFVAGIGTIVFSVIEDGIDRKNNKVKK